MVKTKTISRLTGRGLDKAIAAWQTANPKKQVNTIVYSGLFGHRAMIIYIED